MKHRLHLLVSGLITLPGRGTDGTISDRSHTKPDHAGSFGRSARAALGPALRRPCDHRVCRLHGPRQLRDEHPGRRRLRLCPPVGRGARQSHCHALPGPFCPPRHRDRQEPGRALPRSLSKTPRVGHVGGERDRSHGDGPRRVSRRRDRARAPLQDAPNRRHGDYCVPDLRLADLRARRLPAHGADHHLFRRGDRALLSRRARHCPHRLG